MALWKNAVSGNWSDSTKWDGAVPNGNTAIASFDNVTNAAPGFPPDIDLGGSTFTVKQLNMRSAGASSYRLFNGTLTIAASSGSADINVTAAGSNATASILGSSLTLNLASNTNFDVAAFAVLDVLSTITGAGALNKIGIGTLNLYAPNSAWTGATTIDAGRLRLLDVNALAGSSALTINSGGTLELAASGGGTFNVNALSGAGAVRGGAAGVQTLNIKSGGGVFSGAITDGAGIVALKHDSTGITYLSGNGNTYTGGTTVNAGILLYGDGGSPGASVGTGTVTINGGIFALFKPGDYTFANALAGAGSFDKNLAGIATLTGNNSAFTGKITVGTGTLKASDANSLGNKAPIEVKAGTTLDVSALSAVTIGALSGAGTVATRNLEILNVYSGGTSSTFSGSFTQRTSINKFDSGTLTLSGDGTNFNELFVFGGTLSLSGSNPISTGLSVRVLSSATLDISGIAASSLTIGSLGRDGGSIALGGKKLIVGNPTALQEPRGALTLVGSSGTDALEYRLSNVQPGAGAFLLDTWTLQNWTEGTDVVSVLGGLGDDIVIGTAFGDVINGGGGSDTLTGGGGNDTLTGGGGNDTFVYAARGFGQDIITDFTPFGPNADQIDVSGLGFGDFETLRSFVTTEVSGAIFNFKFNGQAESFKLSGVSFFSLTSNNFIFNTSTAAQTISGTANDDNLWGRAGADTLNGGAGDDGLGGGAGADRLTGGAGNDGLGGGTGNDVFVYDARGFGFDQIGDFTRGEDKIDFSALGIPDFAALAPFLQQLSSGINQIEFKFDGQNETLFITSQVNSPLSADDFIFNTSTTARTVNGTGSADTLFGGLGSDTLNGGVGNDTLVASGGADILNGGTGTDRLIGGAGADIFRGTAAELNGDTIADLAIGERIRFVGVSAAGAPAFSFSLSGNTLTFTGGSLTLENLPAGMRFLTSAAASDNGIDLILRSSNPPVINSDGGGATAARSVAENTSAVTTVQATNPDAVTALTYAITGGADAARFQINTATGALAFIAAPNFEAPTDAGANNVYDVIVSASDGTLTDTQAIAVTVRDVAEAVRSVRNDFNGDGRSDLLWRNSNGQLSSWLGNANGGLTDNGGVVNQFVPAAWRIQGTADFNGDGRADILWRNVSGQLSSWLGSSNGGLVDNGGVVNQFVPLAWKIAGTGDFNGDGRADIVWRNDNGQLSQWLGTANGGLVDNGAIVNQTVPTAWKIMGTGDFNADGFSDVLWRNDNGQLSQWLGSATGRLIDNGGNVNQTVPNAWKIAGTGDFNGDGFSDVLWRNDNGQLSEWLGSANGRLIDNGGIVNQFVPNAWKIAGTGDFNGDGRADIMWRNDSGLMSEWLGTANGGFIDNGGIVNQLVPNAWTIYIQNYQLI